MIKKKLLLKLFINISINLVIISIIACSNSSNTISNAKSDQLKRQTSTETKIKSKTSLDLEKNDLDKNNLNQKPQNEIVPVLNDAQSIGVPIISGETVPKSKTRNGLFNFAKKAFENNELEVAVSFADVLLLQNPGDNEARELRGHIFAKKGDIENSTEDLKMCCDNGRKSCCK